ADLDALDRVRASVDAREKCRRPSDLGALRDLDLVAEGDPPVTGEMEGERSRGRAGGRILRNPTARREHSRLPASAGAREAVDPQIRRQLEPSQVGPHPRNLSV